MLLLVLWALGISMIALAALVHLPHRVLAVLSIAVIALHNGLDGVQPSQFGGLAGLWNVLHQPGVFFLAGVPVVAGYPLVPWIAVMAAGFCAGPVFLRAPRGAPAIPVAMGHGSHRELRACFARSTSTAIRSRGPCSHQQSSPSSRF